MKKTIAVVMSGIFLCCMVAGVAFAQPAGKAIVKNACTKCHDLKRVETANKNYKEWKITLDKMIAKGAAVGPQDYDTVLKYLNTLNK